MYNVYILYLTESGEGQYSFEFAENITIHQFLYSRIIFFSRGIHTYPTILKDDTNKTVLQEKNSNTFLVDINNHFQRCLDFYASHITLKHHGKYQIENTVKCLILNSKFDICDWEWLDEENKFRVTLDRKNFTQTRKDKFEKYGIGEQDIFGVIRCYLKDDNMFRDVKFDLPFVSHSQEHYFFKLSLQSKEMVLMAIVGLTSALILILLLLFCGRKYRRRKKRLNDLTLTGYKTILYIIT